MTPLHSDALVFFVIPADEMDAYKRLLGDAMAGRPDPVFPGRLRRRGMANRRSNTGRRRPPSLNTGRTVGDRAKSIKKSHPLEAGGTRM
jgi:hypothetical protein